MKYSKLRRLIQDGDVALVSGSGLFSVLIRLLTAGTYSHVAVFFWDDNDLFISEVREFSGHRITHASVWLDEQLTIGKHVDFGIAPNRVREIAVAEFIQNRRNTIKRYAYWMLPVVWLSSITGIRIGNNSFVCSHYVQKAWGHKGKSLLPSDFAKLCETLHTITDI